MAYTDYGLNIVAVSDPAAGRDTEYSRMVDFISWGGHNVTKYNTSDWSSITFSNFDVLVMGLDPSNEVSASDIVTAALPTLLFTPYVTDASNVSNFWAPELDLTGTWEVNRNPSGGNAAKVTDNSHWITTHFGTAETFTHGKSYSTFSYPTALTNGQSYIGTQLIEQNGAWETGEGCMFAIDSGTSKLTSGTTWDRIVIFGQWSAASYNGDPTEDTEHLLLRSIEWLGGKDTGNTWDFDFGATAGNEDFDGMTGGSAPTDFTRESGDDQWRVENSKGGWWGSDSLVLVNQNITTPGVYSYDSSLSDDDTDFYVYYRHHSAADAWIKIWRGSEYYMEFRLNPTAQTLKFFDGSAAQIGSTVDLGSVDGDDPWYNIGMKWWLRFYTDETGGSPTLLKGKAWWGSYDDEPAAWDIEETDTYGYGTAGECRLSLAEDLTKGAEIFLVATAGLDPVTYVNKIVNETLQLVEGTVNLLSTIRIVNEVLNMVEGTVTSFARYKIVNEVLNLAEGTAKTSGAVVVKSVTLAIAGLRLFYDAFERVNRVFRDDTLSSTRKMK